MTMRQEAPALRLYRGLLWLYPAEFRDHFAGEMCRALADCLRERPGSLAILTLYLGIFFDAPRERYHMIRQDIVYALRTMRKEKLTTLVATLVLAIGIGSTVTVFTLVNGLLLRPLPYPGQERMVYVEESSRELRSVVAYPNYLDFQSRNQTLSDIAMFGSGLATLRGDMEAERVPAASATEPLFRILGVQPLLGRTFTAEEDRPNAPPTVILSEELWRRRYGADSGIVGKTIGVGSDQARVIGVMPRGFHFPDEAQLWQPLQLDVKHNTRMDHGLEGIARLRGGKTAAQAQDDLRGIMEQITREHPGETYGQTVNVSPYRTRDTQDVKPLLFTLMGAVGFVLLIACANITNLLLVKAAGRTREIAVRGALGASQARLVRQFVVESVILGTGGATLGLLLAWAAIPGLRALAPEQIPNWVQFTPDVRVLIFAVAVTVGTSILTGVVPALSARHANLVETLKEGGRASTTGGAKAWFRSALVVGEVAMSVLLLAGAGLMIQTFWNLNNIQAGFRAENITTLQTSAPSSRYPTGAPAAGQLTNRILKEFQSLPGVISVAATSGVPLEDRWRRSLTVEGRPMLSLKDAPLVIHTVVTPGYFRILGIPIEQGRDFTESDGKNPLVTIVDATLAKRYWPGESAIGKRVRFGPPEWNEPWHTIVGVAGTSRNASLRKIEDSVYLPYAEFEFTSMAYVVRTAGGMADPGSALHARLRAIDRNIAISRVMTMRDMMSRSIWRERFFATVFGVFAILALVLALVGLYGVMAYAVSRRSHEMGIRMALGASAGEIRGMVMAQSGRLVLLGMAAGSLAAVFLTRLLAAQLYGVRAGDPRTLGAVAVLLATAALLASYLPARRATRVDPMVVLREE